jgi:hypothetical protein
MESTHGRSITLCVMTLHRICVFLCVTTLYKICIILSVATYFGNKSWRIREKVVNINIKRFNVQYKWNGHNGFHSTLIQNAPTIDCHVMMVKYCLWFNGPCFHPSSLVNIFISPMHLSILTNLLLSFKFNVFNLSNQPIPLGKQSKPHPPTSTIVNDFIFPIHSSSFTNFLL